MKDKIVFAVVLLSLFQFVDAKGQDEPDAKAAADSLAKRFQNDRAISYFCGYTDAQISIANALRTPAPQWPLACQQYKDDAMRARMESLPKPPVKPKNDPKAIEKEHKSGS